MVVTFENEFDFDVYLTNTKDNTTFHFPVNPSSLTFNRDKMYDTVEIIDVGEVDVNKQGTKIKEINFETLIPDIYEPYCRYTDISDARETIEMLNEWQEQIEPLRLIITGDVGFNDLVNIGTINEDVKPEGIHNGKYFTFTFRTYKELKVNQVDSTLNSNRTSDSSSNSKKIFTVGEWIIITADVLNVRDGPATSYAARGTVKEGECYKIGRVYNNWADIYWSNHGGWICTDYAK